MDKRRMATIAALKQAFLTLYEKMSSDDVTVSSLCKEAGVSRTTFYRIYETTTDVIEALIADIFSQVGSAPVCHGVVKPKTEDNNTPLCEYLATHPDARKIILDPAHYSIVMKHAAAKQKQNVPLLQQRLGFTDAQIKELSIFQFNGCLALIRESAGKDDWHRQKAAVDEIVREKLQKKVVPFRPKKTAQKISVL